MPFITSIEYQSLQFVSNILLKCNAFLALVGISVAWRLSQRVLTIAPSVALGACMIATFGA